jgi:hypothetical protein
MLNNKNVAEGQVDIVDEELPVVLEDTDTLVEINDVDVDFGNSIDLMNFADIEQPILYNQSKEVFEVVDEVFDSLGDTLDESDKIEVQIWQR